MPDLRPRPQECERGVSLWAPHPLQPQNSTRMSTDTDPPVTPREWQVCCQVAKGYPNKRIALNLHIEVGTVEKHIETVAGRLPNPDALPAKTLVMLWSAHRLWSQDQQHSDAA